MKYFKRIQRQVESVEQFVTILNTMLEDKSSSIKNVPYRLTNDSCIIYLTNDDNNDMDDIHRDVRYSNGVFMIKSSRFGNPDEIYEVDKTTYDLRKLNFMESSSSDYEYTTIRTKIYTAIAAEHNYNILKSSVQVSCNDDRIDYNTNTYYVGEHNNGVPNGYGIFARDNNFMFIGEWNCDGLPISGYLSFYVYGFHHLMYIYYDTANECRLERIYYPIYGKFNTPRVRKGQLLNKFDLLRLVNYSTIVISHYVVFTNEFRIVNFIDQPNIFTFTTYYLFAFMRIIIDNVTIIIDELYTLYLVKDKPDTVYLTLQASPKSLDVLSVVLFLHKNKICFNLHSNSGYIGNGIVNRDSKIKYDNQFILNNLGSIKIEEGRIVICFYNEPLKYVYYGKRIPISGIRYELSIDQINDGFDFIQTSYHSAHIYKLLYTAPFNGLTTCQATHNLNAYNKL